MQANLEFRKQISGCLGMRSGRNKKAGLQSCRRILLGVMVMFVILIVNFFFTHGYMY
jgi:hypothetical protein